MVQIMTPTLICLWLLLTFHEAVDLANETVELAVDGVDGLLGSAEQLERRRLRAGGRERVVAHVGRDPVASCVRRQRLDAVEFG